MAVSVKDVAAHAGLSVGTVSNVLNRPEKVATATRERVLASIQQLGFVRNEAARQLRAGLSRTVGLIVLDASNPFFHDVAAGAEHWGARHGISILMGNSAQVPAREDHYLELFEQQRVRGVLISPVGDITPRLQRMRQLGIAGVVVDRVSTHAAVSSVSVDDQAGGRMAVRHLAELGHTRISYVGGPPSLTQVTDRLAGARQVASTQNVTIDPVFAQGLGIQQGAEVGHRLLALPPTERPTAIFAANDLLALGILQAITSQGIRVPHDLALVGYDDITFAAGAAVPLTSVRQPRAEMGARAMELLLVEAETQEPAGEHIVLQPSLVVRHSTDPATSR
ncbi:MAG: LacI family DNA-binding transcriptional regulator [Propioniciclava sp.]